MYKHRKINPKKKDFKKVLSVAEQVESSGVGFFSRSGSDMVIHIRGKSGNDPDQWHNARIVADAVGASSVEMDKISGHVVVIVKNVYPIPKKALNPRLGSGKVVGKVVKKHGRYWARDSANRLFDLKNQDEGPEYLFEQVSFHINENDEATDLESEKFRIIDWASNIVFNDKQFDSFDDAEEFLVEKLGDSYEDERGEYYIVPVKGSRETRFLDPKDPRSGRKSANPRKRISDTFASYLETALWSSVDDDGEPLDRNYDFSDFDEASLEKAEKQLWDFLNRASEVVKEEEFDFDQMAHDFWLTRNRHGAGFWDGDYEEKTGKILTDLSHKFGEVDIYVGDDGKLYFL